MRNDIAFWLNQHCSVHHGTAAGAVLLRRGEALHLASSWPKDQSLPAALSQLAASALARRATMMSQAPDEAGGAPMALVAQPLEASGVMVGVAAVAIRCAQPLTDAEVAALEASAGRFASVLSTPGAKPKDVDDVSPRVLELAGLAFAHTDLATSGQALCAALATVLACDRVSLGLRDGDTTAVAASSDGTSARQDQALSDRLAALDEVMDAEASLLWPLPPESPPRIVAAHAQFARSQGLARLCAVPLVQERQVVGALLLERARDQAFDASAVAVLEGLATTVGPWFARLQADARPWHRRLRQAASDLSARIQGPGQGRYKLAALAAGIVLGVLLLSPTSHEVHAQARLEGTVQRVIAAPGDGYLKQVSVRPGDRVAAGQVLVEFAGEDLMLERRQRLAEAEAADASAREALSKDDRAQLAIQAAKAEALHAQVALLDQRIERAQVRAPFDAVVISGDLSQALGAPVKQGDTLLTLAPADGFRAVVEVEDADIGDVRIGQAGAMVLAAHPDHALPMRVERITPLATQADGRNVFEVEVALLDAPASAGDALRPGMRGVARVQVGQAPRAVLWTRDALAWLRLSTWRWLG